MEQTISFRSDADTNNLLKRVMKYSGRNKSDLIKDSLHKQLRIMELKYLQELATPYLHKAGYYTEEDIFNDPDIS